jgi:hypothetical protein
LRALPGALDVGTAGFELGVAEKAARLRGLRLALQGKTDSQKWLSHVAGATLGGRTGRNGCRAVAWVGREKEEGQDTENIEIINNINKLDKDTLNMYTALRAYG